MPKIGAEARLMIDGFLDLAIANIGRWRVWAPYSPVIAAALLAAERGAIIDEIVARRNAPDVIDAAVRRAICAAIEHHAGPLH
jgi:hypothetical protein